MIAYPYSFLGLHPPKNHLFLSLQCKIIVVLTSDISCTYTIDLMQLKGFEVIFTRGWPVARAGPVQLPFLSVSYRTQIVTPATMRYRLSTLLE